MELPVRLKKGTRLIKAQTDQSTDLIFEECKDTGKFGAYLTNSSMLAFGYIHKHKDISDTFYIHTYEVTKDIAFRKHNHLDSSTVPNQNRPHYDYVTLSLDFDFEDKNEKHLEFFITTTTQKMSLKCIRRDIVKSIDVPEIFRNNFKDYGHLNFAPLFD